MRRIAWACLVSAAVAYPSAIAAQEASRSVEDYVCTFSGQCEGEAGSEAESAPAAKGTPRTSATRGFSLSRPGAKPAAPAAAKGRKPAASVADRTSAAQGQRADLRLSFELGSARLAPVARAEAKVFAQSLMRPELKGMRFAIEGHTDSQGGRSYNIDLSRRRAEAVADYLAELGVSRDRLEVRGFGFDRPIAGQSAADHANRRVEAVRLS